VVEKINKGKNSFREALTPREKKIIQVLRGIDYGEMIIAVQDKQPVQIEEVKKSIKL
jgi:hypothetical protein